MPVLRGNDPLPWQPRRVLVAGSSGSGKSTLAGLLAARWGVPHHERDALYHGPDWVPRPEFTAEVAAVAAGDAWVAEWQYAVVRPMLLARADLVVWLDLPRWLTFGRLLRRTVRRRLHRVELWNGNREPPLRTVFHRPGSHPAVRLVRPHPHPRPDAGAARGRHRSAGRPAAQPPRGASLGRRPGPGREPAVPVIAGERRRAPAAARRPAGSLTSNGCSREETLQEGMQCACSASTRD